MANPMRQKAVQGLKTGDTFTFFRRFSKEETLSFGDLTRDYNPVHYDERWTESKGFDGLICHGLLVGSMVCEFGGQVGWLATGMNFKFIKPVYFDDTVTCTVTVTRLEENGRAEAEAVFVNQNEDRVCQAFMTGLIPVNQDRELLERMVKEGDPTNRLHDVRDTETETNG